MTHMHVTTWVIALILFLISFYLQKKGRDQAQRRVQMILRLFYILILLTGADLLFRIWNFHTPAVIKAVIGLWVIFSMEFIINRGGQGRPTRIFWIQFIIGLVTVLFYGYVYLG